MSRVPTWVQAQPIVERLLALPPEQRESALARECPNDDELLAQLARLLRAAERRRELFEPATGGASGDVVPPEGRAGLQSGDSIGPWRLVRSLGAGGMGEVWLAERADADFRQRVALKLVKRGMDSELVLQRFRRERKVLAQLTHPNIPSLIDGGAAADGRPYLVMEHVEGASLDVFVRERLLDIPERLRLFLKIGEAVQHAHERGVVHRDLKPSNVLVTSAGEPKLLDFGISKVLDAREDSNTLDLTLTGQQMLTPRYASPEQVQGREITAATDVYALGLILWELLVGKPAVSFDGLTQADFVEAVCERDVPRPSSAVEPNATALRRAIAGDLDTICAMALRKEPARRYAGVKQLADDVRRHLDAQPVLARADTMTYRVSKFVRRNRVLVGATFGIMLALAVGLVIALLQYREALRASSAAKRSAYSANLEAAEAALREGDARTALARLEAAPPELRGWEWRHLSSRTDGSELSFPSQPGHSFGNGALAWLGDPESFVAPDGGDLVLRRGAVELERVVLCTPTGVSHAPRSRRIAWCARDGELRVAQPGQSLAQGAIWSHDPPDPLLGVVHQDVQWSPDERWLALSSRDGLRLYDGASGALLHEFPNAVPIQMCGRIRWSPRGPQLARGNWDETVEVFDAQKRERVAQWRAHTMAVLDLAFDESGEHLATCSLDRTAKVWDFQSRSELSVVRRPRTANAVAFLDDGLAVGESNGAIAVLDWRSGEVLRRLIGHTQPIVALELTPDRSKLLSVGTTDSVRVWSSQTRDVLEARTCEFVNAVSSSPDGLRFATSSPDGFVRVWDTATCEVLCASRLDRSWALGVDWSRDGRWIATAHDTHTVGLWDADTLEPVRTFEEQPGWHAVAVAFAPDSSSLAAVQIGPQYHPCRARSWSLDGRELGSREIPFGSPQASVDLVLDARGAPRLVSGGYVELDAWTARGEPTRIAPFHEQAMVSATASPDCSLFAAAYLTEVFVARADDFEILASFDTSADMVRALAFHPSEPRLAVSVGECIELWDYTVPFRAATLLGHQGPVTGLSWTPDGETLLSVSWDGGVRVWRAGR